MAKFPTNLLLYTITLSLLGGSGFYFYEAVNLPPQPDHKKNRKLAMSAFERGKSRDPVAAGTKYNDSPLWENFAKANFTGKLPPVVKDPTESKGPEKPAVSALTPLEDIFTVRGIYFDASGSRVIISYKPSANVQPPASQMSKLVAAQEIQRQPEGARAAAANRARRGAAGRRGSRGSPVSTPIPNSPNAGQVHHLSLEDPDEIALWPPYEHIRLVSVSPDAEHAVFQRQESGKDPKEWAEIKMYKGTLDLPREVYEQLEKGARAGTGAISRMSPELDSQVKGDNPWRPTKNTTLVRKGLWDIGEEEIAQIRDNPSRVFNEDVGIRQYSGHGGRKGLQITKISRRFESFGFRVGEIIIALNGETVKTRAQALTLGKKLYQRGVRTFRIKVLTSQGYTEDRIYNAPN